MSDHLSKEQMARYRGRQISPKELIEVDGHLSHCRNCREEIAQTHALDAALAPRTSVPKTESNGHLAYEQLETYVDGRMPAADRNALRSHTQSCPACAEDLRDLEGFRDELEHSLERRERIWPETRESKGWRGLFAHRFTPLRAAAGLAAVALIAILIWQHGRPAHEGNGEAISRPVPQGTPAGSSSLSSEIAALQPAEQQAVRQAIERRKLVFPPAIRDLTGSGGTLMGEPSQKGPRFAVSSPAGELVLDTHPLFHWRPLPGAVSYSVTVFDAGLNSVVSSPALHDTQWKSSRALNRGRVYLWQVTATLGDGTTVNSPRPPSPEAKFQVLEQTRAEELEQFRQSHPDAHLLLGILYAQAGVLDVAEEELKQLPATDSDYPAAQEFLANIKQMRRAKS